MPYSLTASQKQELLQLWNFRDPDGVGVKFDDIYRKLIEFIEDVPDSDVQTVEVFLRGAQQVNAGIGNFSEMIRAYTQRELELRSPSVPSGGEMEQLLQQASNAIADSIVRDILNLDPNHENPNGTLPAIGVIAEYDASQAVQKFFDPYIAETDSAVANGAGWAGTPFFSHFGDWQMWRFLSAGETVGASQASYTMNRLDDLRNVLFALDSMSFGMESQTLPAWTKSWIDDWRVNKETFGEQRSTFWSTLTNTLGQQNSSVERGYELAAAKVLSAFASQSPALAGLFSALGQIGRNSALDQIRGAYDGRIRFGTTSETFVNTARNFFAAITVPSLQSIGAESLAGANVDQLVAKALTADRYRNALRGLSSLVLELPSYEGRAVDLYDAATGAGSITQRWIEARAKMLVLRQLMDQYNAPYDELWAPSATPFAPVISDRLFIDQTSGLTLGIDGIDGGFFDPVTAIFGSAAANIIAGNTGKDEIFGEEGDDILSGGGENDYLEGGSGADLLDGGSGDDELLGGVDDDVLVSGAGHDILDGGAGDDTYTISAGAESTTIRDADGDGSILVQNSSGPSYTLGSNLEAVPNASGAYEDSKENFYRLSNSVLTVTLHDGRTIKIEDFQEGDLGISLPGDETATPDIPPADHIAILPDPGDNDPDSHPVSSPGIGVIGERSSGIYSGLGNYSELIDASAVTTGRPHWYLWGGFGDSYLVGLANTSNIINDDWWEDGTGLHWIGADVGDDIIIGGNGPGDVIETHGGNDTVFAGDGYDIVTDNPADPGDGYGSVEWVNAGNSNKDRIYGEGGSDFLITGAGEAFIDGGEGDDMVFGGAHDDTLLGGEGDDVLSGDTRQQSNIAGYTPYFIEVNYGEIGNEVVHFGSDVLDGGAGADQLVGGGGNDYLYGGADDDILQGDYVFSPNGSWTLVPGVNMSIAAIFSEHDLDPQAIHGVDYLWGEGGNDYLVGGGGSDELDGGADDDVLYGDIPGFAQPIDEAYQGDDRLFGRAGNDTLYGNGGDDYLDGGDGADYLAGDSPEDLFLAGKDELHGGNDNDTLFGMGGDDRLFGDGGDDTLYGDNGNSGGASGDDLLEGGDGNDLLLGDGGNDVLRGGAGHDQLQGGAGNDILETESGDDALFGEAGADTFMLSAGAGHVQITDTEGENVLMFGPGIGANDVRATRANGNIRIYFSSTDYAFMTAATFDTFSAVRFADGSEWTASDLEHTFEPGTLSDHRVVLGADVSLGQIQFRRWNYDLVLGYTGSVSNWVDTASLSGRDIGYRLVAGGDYGLPPGSQALVLTNWYVSSPSSYLNQLVEAGGNSMGLLVPAIEAPAMFTQAGAGGAAIQGAATSDILMGGSGADILDSGDGNDELVGGAGVDFLSGGSGDDVYRFNAGAGLDLIVDDSGADDVVRFGPGITVSDLLVTESTSGLEVQVGLGSNEDQLTILNWAQGGARSIDRFVFDDGSSLDRNAIDLLNTGNHSPRAGLAIATQMVEAEQPFSYTIPATAFTDSDTGDSLTYSATLDGGAPLPEWLNFDPGTRTFSGTPPTGINFTELQVIVRATDSGLLASEQAFSLIQSVTLTGTEGGDSLTGGAGVDHILGLGGDDILRGAGNDDFLEGGDGDDVLLGGLLEEEGTGNDTLDGGAGSDIYYAGDGNDVITDSAGHDNIYAGSGDDTIQAGPGSDQIRGEQGSDTILYNRGNELDEIIGTTGDVDRTDVLRFGPGILPSDIVFDSDWLPWTNEAGIRMTLKDAAGELTDDVVLLRYYFEAGTSDGMPNRIEFTDAPGTVWTQVDLEEMAFTPTDGNNYIRGTAAVDTIDGLGGNDKILGLEGADILTGGAGDDYLLGGEGNDAQQGGDGNDRLHGEDGDDSLIGGTGTDDLIGGAGNDEMQGNADEDTLNGGTGDDLLDGGAGNDILYGGRGDDTFLIERASVREWDEIYRNESTDYSVPPPTEVDTLRFGAGILPTDLRVWQYDEYNTRIDIIDSTGVTNSIGVGGSYGGVSIDVVEFVDAPQTVLTRADIEALSVIGNNDNNNIFGYGAADVMRGNDGNDNLTGRNGDDDLSGGAGDDQLYGNAGNDTFRFGAGQGSDEIFDLSGSNRVVLDAGVTPSHVTLYRTSSGGRLGYVWEPDPTNADSLVLVIDGGADQLMIESFFDAAQPNSIAELVFGDGTVWDNATIRNNVVDLAGTANSSTGTSGNDSFTVDHRGDSISDPSGTDVDTVTANVSYTLPWNVENLILTGPFNIDGTGNTGGNTITGNNYANTLYGAGGADTLIGGLGDDTYRVGLLGAPYGVTVIELAGEGYDTLLTVGTSSYALPDNVERLIAEYAGPGTVFTGNSLDNIIDAHQAYAANLTLDGGAGADTMIGGWTSNRYIVDNTGDVVIGSNIAAIGGMLESHDTVVTSISYTLPSGIEDLELTGSAAIAGTGNSENNFLNGSQNSAANQLIGGAGDDTYLLGAGDTYVENPGEGSDTLLMVSPAGNPENAYNVADYQNIEGLTVTDAALSATLIGDSTDNRLTGNSSVNWLDGGMGNDLLAGGANNDHYYGFGVNSGLDVIKDTAGWDSVYFDAEQNIDIEQVQFTREDNDLVITASPESQIRIQEWFEGSSNKIENLYVFNQGIGYGYSASQIESRALAVNSAPVLINSISGGIAGFGQLYQLQLPQNIFSDVESQYSLSYAAELSDGSALPAWLSFDAQTRTFSGTPTVVDDGDVEIRVTATDPGGLSGETTFTISVTAPPIVGTPGNDVLTGDNHRNFIYGLGGNDTAYGQEGNDEIYGDEGDDTLYGEADDDMLDGGSGNNTLDGGAGFDTLYGGNDSDMLYGQADDDYLQGFDGDDLLDGGSGSDEMYGGAGNDIYTVDTTGDYIEEDEDAGTDTVQSSIAYTLGSDLENLTLTGSANINGTGNSLDNVLTGNSGNNTLIGSSGNDTLDPGSAGTDVLQGGQGNDTYIVNRSNGVTVSESSNQGTDIVQASVSYTLANNVENLILTGSGNINGTGNSAANTITGNSGSNTLSGAGGADSLIGGAGNDTYVVDHVGDTVTELAAEGTDLVQSSVTYTLSAEVENLTLTGSSAIDGTGNTLNNTLTGNTGNNALNGGAGNDTYIVQNTGDTVNENAAAGTDTVQSSVTFTLANNVENLTLTGSSAINGTGNTLDNILTGNSGNSTLTGLGGNDTLDPGSAGTDALLGGQGNDTYIIARTSGITITENSGEGTDTVQASVTHTLANNVENLTLTGTNAINGTGNTLVNILTGNSNNNTLDGGTGADSMVGGAGNDIYIVDNTSDSITELAGEGTDQVNGSATYTLTANVENLTLTGTAAINGTGNTLDNILTGNSGNNTLTASDGNDTLDPGSAGTDSLLGGIGNDTYVVTRSTGITITENTNEGTDQVNASVTYTLGNNLENLTLTGSSAINATGNTLDNGLTGNSGNNTLTGGGGNDTLDPGSAGTDSMSGGTGNDTYVVNRSTGITVTENSNEGIDAISASVTTTLGNNIELLFLTGSSTINGTGNTLNNLLRGNTGNNTLAGGTGVDILEGGDGTDTLSDSGGNTLLNGGAGTDTLTSGTTNDILIGGIGNDALTTGTGADIIAFNKGDGQDTVAASTTKDNTLAIGGGAVYADLLFQKSGNDLILKVGASDQITFTGYYTGSNKSVDKLQIVIEGTSDYNAGSGNAMNNKKIETFNFDSLVTAFDTARAANPSLTTWALTNALLAQHLGGSDTAAIGGDLAYRYGRFGNLSDISFTPAAGILGAAGFGSSTQTLQSLGSLQDTSPRLS